MSEDTKNSRKKDLYISSIEPTNDCITKSCRAVVVCLIYAEQ